MKAQDPPGFSCRSLELGLPCLSGFLPHVTSAKLKSFQAGSASGSGTTKTGSKEHRMKKTPILTFLTLIFMGTYLGASSWNAQAETITPLPGDTQQRGKPGSTSQSQISSPMLFSAGALSGRYEHTAIWTGSEMIIWGGENEDSGVPMPLGDGARYNPASNTWSAVSSSGAPAARYGHTAIWTGSEMIIWGGNGNSGVLGDGALYNPVTDTWRAMSSSGAPAVRYGYTAVWTGSEMIIWDGKSGLPDYDYLGDGARYNPVTDTWRAMSSSGAPAARYGHTVIWTGSEMIVWGGWNGYDNYLSDGARYHPASDTWSAMSSIGAPSALYVYTTIWTGSEMIIWGMNGNGGTQGDGARYHPASDTWSPIASSSAPTVRNGHTAIWTGSEMIVWGGKSDSGVLGDGARYHPASDTWSGMASNDAPASRFWHTAIWTGSEMIIWGGLNGSFDYLGEGARYNPVTNIWIANCYPLIVGHTGKGLDPTSSPTHSNGCPDGQYHAEEHIELAAYPAADYYTASWEGTTNVSYATDHFWFYMPSSPVTVVAHYLTANILDFATSSAFPNELGVLYGQGKVPWFSSLCGSCWTPLKTNPSEWPPSQIAMVPRSDGTMRFLVTVNWYGIYRTSYTGASWALQSLPKTCDEPRDHFTNLVVSPFDPERLYVTKYCTNWIIDYDYLSYSIYTSPDGGLTWQRIRGTGQLSENWGDIIVSPVVSTRVYTLYNQYYEHTWYQSDDLGQTWVPRNFPVDQLALDAKHQDWLYGFYRSLYSDYIGERSTDGGTTWTPWSENPCEDVQQLLAHPTQSSVLFLRCETGLYRSSNGGDKWEQLSTTSGQVLKADYGKPGRLLWAKDGEVWTSEDAGSTWVLRGSPWNQVLPCLSGFLPSIAR
jgi:hypothetical protein